MNESPSTVDDLLPQSVLERADRICDRFEDAWLAGRRPRIEDYLGDVPQGRQRDDLLEKLIAVDIFHRRKQGETPKPGDYQSRFPSLPAGWLAAAAGMPTVSPGRYRLGDKIGHGGMGDVLRGRDLHLSRDLAVKVRIPR
jgi:serine/threonine-protein kinase